MENRSKPASLLTAESIMLGVRHEKEGKLRVTYAHWDDAKVVLDGQVFRRNGAIDPLPPPSSHPPRKTEGGARRIMGPPLCPKNVRNRPRLSKPRA